MRLERVGRDGSRVAVAPTPPEIHAAVTALSAERDMMLLARGAGYELCVLPLRGEQVAVSLERGGERRWLGRGDDETRFSEGDGLVPAKVLVPRTWASSVIAMAVVSTGWPATFPWHDDPGFAPLDPIRLEEVSYARCVAAPEATIRVLAAAVAQHLDGGGDAADVIAELRRVGHDLWSLDQHDDAEIWGSDYMRLAEGQALYLEIAGARPAKVYARFGEAEAES